MTLTDEERRKRRNEYQRRWAQKNKDKVAATARRYREKNRERIAEQKRELRRKNREEVDRRKREWEAANPELVSMQHVRRRLKRMNRVLNNTLQHHYSVTLDEYKEVLRVQGEVCAICLRHEPTAKAKRLFVDHCHNSGRLRALLCHRCNAGLGYFKDNLALLDRARAYLATFSEDSPGDGWLDGVRHWLKVAAELELEE